MSTPRDHFLKSLGVKFLGRSLCRLLEYAIPECSLERAEPWFGLPVCFLAHATSPDTRRYCPREQVGGSESRDRAPVLGSGVESFVPPGRHRPLPRPGSCVCTMGGVGRLGLPRRKQQKFIVSESWRPEVRDQGVGQGWWFLPRPLSSLLSPHRLASVQRLRPHLCFLPDCIRAHTCFILITSVRACLQIQSPPEGLGIRASPWES